MRKTKKKYLSACEIISKPLTRPPLCSRSEHRGYVAALLCAAVRVCVRVHTIVYLRIYAYDDIYAYAYNYMLLYKCYSMRKVACLLMHIIVGYCIYDVCL